VNVGNNWDQPEMRKGKAGLLLFAFGLCIHCAHADSGSATALVAHGSCMVVAWTLFKPAAVATVKYARTVAPEKRALWNMCHVCSNVACLLLSVAGAAAVLVGNPDEEELPHGVSHTVVGVVLVCFSVVEAVLSSVIMHKERAAGRPSMLPGVNQVRRFASVVLRLFADRRCYCWCSGAWIFVHVHGTSRGGEWFVHHPDARMDDACIRMRPCWHHLGLGFGNPVK